MDYPRGKLGDCIFSRFGFIAWTDTQIYMYECFTPVTVIGMSNSI